MDKKTILGLIPQTPSPTITLCIQGHYRPRFILDGRIDAINDDSLIFTTSQKTSAIRFSEIIEIILSDRREF